MKKKKKQQHPSKYKVAQSVRESGGVLLQKGVLCVLSRSVVSLWPFGL